MMLIPRSTLLLSTVIRSRCSLTQGLQNLLDPVPQDKKETFDVLHLRLLVLGLPTGQWKTACENLFQLLKPGGYLQWEEGDFR
jgi:hypothetical protein